MESGNECYALEHVEMECPVVVSRPSLRLLWPKRHSFYQFLCNPRSLHNTATSSRSATTAYKESTEIGG